VVRTRQKQAFSATVSKQAAETSETPVQKEARGNANPWRFFALEHGAERQLPPKKINGPPRPAPEQSRQSAVFAKE